MGKILRIGEWYALFRHKVNQLNIRYFSLLAVATIMCLYAVKQVSAQGVEPAATAADMIRTEAKSQYGMLGVHEVGNKVYLEIPDSLLGRDILAVNRIAKGWAGDKPFDPFLNFIGYSGDLMGGTLFRFGKEQDGTINLYIIDYSNRVRAEHGAPMLPPNADLLPVFQSLIVLYRNKADDASVIDGTDFLAGDNSIMTFSPTLREKFGVGSMNGQHSSLQSIEVTDTHTVTSSVKTYGYRNGETVRLAARSTWFLLPEIPYEIREPDHRVGYYTEAVKDYSDPFKLEQSLRMVKRWRMEPRPADKEAYFRGELVEPAKPIVIYIDPAMPEAWVPYMIQGINDWQPAFEQAGFKNAIRGEQVPPGMESRMVGDARYPMICYKPSHVRNATAELVTDPRSGEIVNAHIAWHHGYMNNILKWGRAMGAVHRKELRGNAIDTAFIGAMIRKAIAHEVGHVLGLLHNFGASSTVPVENLRSAEWLAENPISPSIMDYVRVNYVAQPQDSVPLLGLIPRIGPYDRWAVEWGYRLNPQTGGRDAVLSRREEWTRTKLADPLLWYGDQDRVDDPRCQAEDLGDDPVLAATYGMANLERLTDSLLAWNGGSDQPDLPYSDLFEQYANYIRHAAVALNGDEDRCGAALAFLDRHFFSCPAWFPVSDSTDISALGIEGAMKRLVREIIPLLIARGAKRPDETCTADMQHMLFASDSGRATAYRRSMQVAYTEALVGMLYGETVGEFPTLTYAGRLRLSMAADDLRQQLQAALMVTQDGLQRAHLTKIINQLTNKLN